MKIFFIAQLAHQIRSPLDCQASPASIPQRGKKIPLHSRRPTSGNVDPGTIYGYRAIRRRYKKSFFTIAQQHRSRLIKNDPEEKGEAKAEARDPEKEVHVESNLQIDSETDPKIDSQANPCIDSSTDAEANNARNLPLVDFKADSGTVGNAFSNFHLSLDPAPNRATYSNAGRKTGDRGGEIGRR